MIFLDRSWLGPCCCSCLCHSQPKALQQVFSVLSYLWNQANTYRSLIHLRNWEANRYDREVLYWGLKVKPNKNKPPLIINRLSFVHSVYHKVAIKTFWMVKGMTHLIAYMSFIWGPFSLSMAWWAPNTLDPSIIRSDSQAPENAGSVLKFLRKNYACSFFFSSLPISSSSSCHPSSILSPLSYFLWRLIRVWS